MMLLLFAFLSSFFFIILSSLPCAFPYEADPIFRTQLQGLFGIPDSRPSAHAHIIQTTVIQIRKITFAVRKASNVPGLKIHIYWGYFFWSRDQQTQRAP